MSSETEDALARLCERLRAQVATLRQELEQLRKSHDAIAEQILKLAPAYAKAEADLAAKDAERISDKERLDWLGNAIAISRTKGPPHVWDYEVGFYLPRKNFTWRRGIDFAIRAERSRKGKKR